MIKKGPGQGTEKYIRNCKKRTFYIFLKNPSRLRIQALVCSMACKTQIHSFWCCTDSTPGKANVCVQYTILYFIQYVCRVCTHNKTAYLFPSPLRVMAGVHGKTLGACELGNEACAQACAARLIG